jgi:hypothetical protein
MPSYEWQKSFYSSEGGNCMNIAAAPDGTLRIRESDDPDVILATVPGPLGSLLIAIKADRLPGRSLELPGATGHVGALPGLEFLPLDFAAATAVESAEAAGVDCRAAHAVFAAVSGAVEGHVLTADPGAYDGTGVRAVDIGKS